MVLATDRTDFTHHTAAGAAALLRLRRETMVLQVPLGGCAGFDDLCGVAVLAPDQGLAQWFPDSAQELNRLALPAGVATARGWRITVLVPTRRMGEARRALRGTPVTLQPWWVDGERVRFGGIEAP